MIPHSGPGKIYFSTWNISFSEKDKEGR
uniref:Uncharacterized protein n=1 Tax=Rhizophora mucronata TaxID=61149 RepID=A0A2P2QCR2_RHIMU